ncbi:UNVERIFIED_CONTAM: Elongation factor 1-beta 1 [Sesamum latifolium]|uniref:Elongation factor 1-beta 1 n=1 Tax=Sesamum latifolium TaxID=2727402 RepID=A0AAW2X247_9LAMI
MGSGLKAIDQFLSDKSYISGSQLTNDDVKIYIVVLEKPSGDLYVNASKWYEAISAKLAPNFLEKAVRIRIGGQVAPTQAVALATDAN